RDPGRGLRRGPGSAARNAHSRRLGADLVSRRERGGLRLRPGALGGDGSASFGSVRLVELAAALPGAEMTTAGKDLGVTRVESDSRRVQPGDLFVAIRGEKFDGLAHAAE